MTQERVWRKSTHSGATEDDNCVELSWRKSSHSGGTEDSDCVEVALPGDALVRDSKNPSGGVLTFSRTAWKNFLETR
ncbi:protein of unknown function [Lentzea fradiae]|uniref:DUF397 domain-containing protein n=1 Tax=Lentzea fradiae TaxID=200378 RepID=A0A1G7NSH7_9PSEU|nr:DUF397 domain-containing protein [Lentzea fradiae]SDF77025.1 protein of unknown function [Lentzea fradiae]